MEQDQLDTTVPAGQDHEDWVAPTLTDLGSFEELTENGIAGSVDAEGMS